MSNILFLTQLLPYPLDAGPKTRAYYVLKHLARSHQVTLLSFSRPDDPDDALEHLRGLCGKVVTIPMFRSVARDAFSMLRSLLTHQPFVISRDHVPGMSRAIQKIIREHNFDYVHADQLWMVQYALQAQNEAAQLGQRLRVVLDQHNAVYLIPKRLRDHAGNPILKLFLGRESRLLARFEADVCRQCDHVVWVTADDFKAIYSLDGDLLANSLIIPICVDPSQVRPSDGLSPKPIILFLGGMHWPPNAEGIKWFVREVFPRIRNELPEAQLSVVGKSPPREILSLEGLQAPGFVEDLHTYWGDSRVFIVPIHAAGGMRVKILDAWAHRLPVVSTSIGAEGIIYQAGRNILIADGPEEFARSVIQLINDDQLAEYLAKSGRENVEDYYDWNDIYRAWDEIYPPVISK